MAHGLSPISPERCVAIWEATDGEVTRQELRPEDWHKIWPELRAAPPRLAMPAV
jgi:DNA-binding transcriptional regulator YdaS (Cro superfamily)